MMWATLVVALLAAGYFGWYLAAFNAFVRRRNAVDQAWSNVEVELNRRLDLIDNLVAVVRGYAAHERASLENVIAARQGIDPAAGRSAEAANQTHAATVGLLTRLVAVVEAYPELKADAQFRNLSTELTRTEDRIAERRQAYNQTVNLYLNLKHSFPALLVDRLHEFPGKAFFDAPDDLVNPVPRLVFP